MPSHLQPPGECYNVADIDWQAFTIHVNHCLFDVVLFSLFSCRMNIAQWSTKIIRVNQPFMSLSVCWAGLRKLSSLLNRCKEAAVPPVRCCCDWAAREWTSLIWCTYWTSCDWRASSLCWWRMVSAEASHLHCFVTTSLAAAAAASIIVIIVFIVIIIIIMNGRRSSGTHTGPAATGGRPHSAGGEWSVRRPATYIQSLEFVVETRNLAEMKNKKSWKKYFPLGKKSTSILFFFEN